MNRKIVLYNNIEKVILLIYNLLQRKERFIMQTNHNEDKKEKVISLRIDEKYYNMALLKMDELEKQMGIKLSFSQFVRSAIAIAYRDLVESNDSNEIND